MLSSIILLLWIEDGLALILLLPMVTLMMMAMIKGHHSWVRKRQKVRSQNFPAVLLSFCFGISEVLLKVSVNHLSVKEAKKITWTWIYRWMMKKFSSGWRCIKKKKKQTMQNLNANLFDWLKLVFLVMTLVNGERERESHFWDSRINIVPNFSQPASVSIPQKKTGIS